MSKTGSILSCSVRFCFLLTFFIGSSRACHSRYAKELRYLDNYLGIKPTNDGNIRLKPSNQFVQYIPSSQSLTCNMKSDCLWSNVPSDDLLDTSEFYLFKKHNSKPFPLQIQPGKKDPPKGTHFLVAGNTTVRPQSAVLLSAPVACQKANGTLSFNYWLYNFAQLQVMVVKASRRRHHLQVYLTPVDEPFRLAIRAFSLKDDVVGSLVLINDIQYSASICDRSPVPAVFNSYSLIADYGRSSVLKKLSQLDCKQPPKHCRWANYGPTRHAAWRLGVDTREWNEVMKVDHRASRPDGPFIFLAVDGLTPRPFAKFVSDPIPCTQKASTLKFMYWTKLGTQVEVCSLDENNLPLSCAYLTEEDAPGPIEIDVDAYSKPFRFSFEIINFDAALGGLAAISNITVRGLLCSQEGPPVTTTIHPNTIANMFALTPRPYFNGTYPLNLNCDFTTDPCYQWLDDEGKMLMGTAPEDSDDFPFPEDTIRGNVAVIMLTGNDSAVIRSRDMPCAYNLAIIVNYMRTEHGFIRVCAAGKCAHGSRTNGGISLTVSSIKPFQVTIEMRSRSNAIIVLDSILAEGDACPLRTVEQTLCENIKCSFEESLCSYDVGSLRTGDTPFLLDQQKGELTVIINSPYTRAYLESARFELIEPALLVISVTQFTFGSRFYICPNANTEEEFCTLLLGPRVLMPTLKVVKIPLGVLTKQFALVASHDKSEEFGEATFTEMLSKHFRAVGKCGSNFRILCLCLNVIYLNRILEEYIRASRLGCVLIHSIDVRTEDDDQMCF